MAVPTKTTRSLTNLTMASWASGVTLISTPIDVSTKFSGDLFVRFGRTVATALTNELTFRAEVSYSASADNSWIPKYAWTTSSGKTASVATAATAAAAGGKVITVTNTGFAVQDSIFCFNGTLANSEFARVVSLTSTTALNVEDNLVTAQTTSTITRLAESWLIPIDFSNALRFRLVCDGSVLAGVTTVIDCDLTTLDSVA